MFGQRLRVYRVYICERSPATGLISQRRLCCVWGGKSILASPRYCEQERGVARQRRPGKEKRQGTAALHDAIALIQAEVNPTGFGVRLSPATFLLNLRQRPARLMALTSFAISRLGAQPR